MSVGSVVLLASLSWYNVRSLHGQLSIVNCKVVFLFHLCSFSLLFLTPQSHSRAAALLPLE
jgi:hypothetical protein